jgi:hypothetical protein
MSERCASCAAAGVLWHEGTLYCLACLPNSWGRPGRMANRHHSPRTLDTKRDSGEGHTQQSGTVTEETHDNR